MRQEIQTKRIQINWSDNIRSRCQLTGDWGVGLEPNSPYWGLGVSGGA